MAWRGVTRKKALSRLAALSPLLLLGVGQMANATDLLAGGRDDVKATFGADSFVMMCIIIAEVIVGVSMYIVRVAPDRKSGSREWWQLFRLVSQWHCDVVITDRDGHIVAAVELDDRSHQAPKRQRRDLLLEEVLKQAGIPLLRGDDEQHLAERVRAHLCAQRPEGTA